MIKRCVLILLFSLWMCHNCRAQEWMTSVEAAKRIAWVQDKMILMSWENATSIPYPISMINERGVQFIFEDLFENEEINKILWNYFVPLKVDEKLYGELFNQIKDTRNKKYIRQFKDDNIKVMDVNLNIVNTTFSPEAYFDLSEFVSNYALNTSFLKAELKNYSMQPDFSTSFRLASKYMDYAILANGKIRADIVNLAGVYLDEADNYLLESDLNKSQNFQQKSPLLRISQYLILNKPRKVLRLVKNYEISEMDDTDVSMLAFLYYTAYKLKKEEGNAEQWKSKVSLINLKKAELICKIYD